MNRIILVTALLLTTIINAKAQDNYSYVQQGEFGITGGAAHYFGDLNPSASVNRIKPSFGLFFRKQFGNYIGVRLAGRFAQLGYSDTYSTNEFQKIKKPQFQHKYF